MNDYSLPPAELLAQQAAWLAPARARLLRRAEIGRRRNVLDLACGSGAVTDELALRSGGNVVAVDCSRTALADRPKSCPGAIFLRANAEQLPFADRTFDLVFCQFALLWLDAPTAARQIRRVLAPGGALVAIEPDYGGMIEYPPEIATRDLWLAALPRAGADPYVGRKLPSMLASLGFTVRVDLFDQLAPPSPLRFELLGGLPLMDAEIATLDRARQADRSLQGSSRVVHLPLFLVTASV
jgi:SAM-dependent methyltransferase